MSTCNSIAGMKLEVEHLGSNSRNKETKLCKTLTRTMHHFLLGISQTGLLLKLERYVVDIKKINICTVKPKVQSKTSCFQKVNFKETESSL